MIFTLEGLVTFEHQITVEIQLTPQHLSEITRYPDAIDKPLIIAMNGYYVFPLNKKVGNVDLVIKIRLGIACGRTFGYKPAVYVQLIVIISTYTHNSARKAGESNVSSINYMSVAKRSGMRGCNGIVGIVTSIDVIARLVKFNVIYVDWCQIIKIGM